MRAKRVIISCAVSLLSMFSIFGCAAHRNLEEMGLQICIGYDRLENGRLKGTTVLHQFDEPEAKPVQIITCTANTSKGIRQTANLKTSRKLVSGQLRVALYGEETAKGGIISLVDTLSRDSKVGTMMYLAVSKGETYDLLTHKYNNILNIGTYIYDAIHQNIDGEQIPSATLHDFLQAYYSEGKDPVLPFLELKKEDDEIHIVGLALFNDAHMVGTILPREGFYLKLIKDKFKAGQHELSISKNGLEKYIYNCKKEDKIFLSFDNIKSQSKITLVDPKRPAFDIHIKMDTRIQEISTELDLANPKVIKIIEEKIKKELEQEANKLLSKLKRLKTDPIGFGKIYSSSVRNSRISKDKWRDMYKDAEINIIIETAIIRSGVID